MRRKKEKKRGDSKSEKRKEKRGDRKSEGIETGLWTVRTEKPYAVSIIKDLEVPAWVNPIFTPAPLATTLLYDLAVGRTPVSCTIDESKVQSL